MAATPCPLASTNDLFVTSQRLASCLSSIYFLDESLSSSPLRALENYALPDEVLLLIYLRQDRQLLLKAHAPRRPLPQLQQQPQQVNRIVHELVGFKEGEKCINYRGAECDDQDEGREEGRSAKRAKLCNDATRGVVVGSDLNSNGERKTLPSNVLVLKPPPTTQENTATTMDKLLSVHVKTLNLMLPPTIRFVLLTAPPLQTEIRDELLQFGSQRLLELPHHTSAAFSSDTHTPSTPPSLPNPWTDLTLHFTTLLSDSQKRRLSDICAAFDVVLRENAAAQNFQHTQRHSRKDGKRMFGFRWEDLESAVNSFIRTKEDVKLSVGFVVNRLISDGYVRHVDCVHQKGEEKRWGCLFVVADRRVGRGGGQVDDAIVSRLREYLSNKSFFADVDLLDARSTGDGSDEREKASNSVNHGWKKPETTIGVSSDKIAAEIQTPKSDTKMRIELDDKTPTSSHDQPPNVESMDTVADDGVESGEESEAEPQVYIKPKDPNSWLYRLTEFSRIHYPEEPLPLCAPVKVYDTNNPDHNSKVVGYRAQLKVVDFHFETSRIHRNPTEASEDVARLASQFMLAYWEAARDTERLRGQLSSLFENEEDGEILEPDPGMWMVEIPKQLPEGDATTQSQQPSGTIPNNNPHAAVAMLASGGVGSSSTSTNLSSLVGSASGKSRMYVQLLHTWCQKNGVAPHYEFSDGRASYGAVLKIKDQVFKSTKVHSKKADAKEDVAEVACAALNIQPTPAPSTTTKKRPSVPPSHSSSPSKSSTSSAKNRNNHSRNQQHRKTQPQQSYHARDDNGYYAPPSEAQGYYQYQYQPHVPEYPPHQQEQHQSHYSYPQYPQQHQQQQQYAHLPPPPPTSSSFSSDAYPSLPQPSHHTLPPPPPPSAPPASASTTYPSAPAPAPSPAPTQTFPLGKNPITQLNEYCQRHRLTLTLDTQQLPAPPAPSTSSSG
ncbi:hypothetical protein HK102_014066, partial [Quaeritorhiza haematococci]